MNECVLYDAMVDEDVIERKLLKPLSFNELAYCTM